MSNKVDPSLLAELKHFGVKDASKCFHCGTCTSVCTLSKESYPLPRKAVKYAQLGLRDKLKSSPEPWLCYYCGDCSERCPRDADPGETMMGLRRWLTAQYDFTGISRKFYTSHAFEFGAIGLLMAMVAAAFVLFHGPILTDEVALTTFAPTQVIGIFDTAMAALLSIVLLTNVFRCAKMVMKGEKFMSGGKVFGVPMKYYFQKMGHAITAFTFQKPWKECTDRVQWLMHFFIFSGYVSVFLMVVVFLNIFQRDAVISPGWPTVTMVMSFVGYYATTAIMIGTTYAIIGRLKKSKRPYKNSHATDWVFLILLQLTTITGILVHGAIALNMPMFTYVVYVIHMMVLVPMLVLEVPFAKWAHMAYRPTVLFLARVKEAYDKDQSAA